MHRFGSSRALFRLRLGSFFFILLYIGMWLLIPAVLWGTVLGHREDLYYSAIIIGVILVSGLGYLIIGSGVRCPLCHGPVIGKPGFSRNKKAVRTIGSYRLNVALRVLLIGRYRCPCCGEPCQCKTRI